MKIPNFFIVGAPKCGTTAMYEYLKCHPEIFMSPVKEPYYFGQDLTNRMRQLTIDEYLALFSNRRDEKVVGEASITYLYSVTAAREIYQFNSEAKILIMLRDPTEMMYSLHSQLRFVGVEDIEDFEAAIAAESERRKGRRIPGGATIVEFLHYRGFADYEPQVRRYFEIFGRQAVHVILFDELREDPSAVYRGALEFLDVDPEFQPPTFDAVNANKVLKNTWLRNLLSHEAVLRATRVVVPYRPLRQRLAGLVNRSLIVDEHPREPMDDKVHKNLKREFAPRVKALSRLLGVDLSETWVR